jgi:hypothetical protein
MLTSPAGTSPTASLIPNVPDRRPRARRPSRAELRDRGRRRRVQAATAGDMAAVGLARADDAELLAGAGADLVVTSLDDVDLAALSYGRLAKRRN